MTGSITDVEDRCFIKKQTEPNSLKPLYTKKSNFYFGAYISFTILGGIDSSYLESPV